MHGAAADVKVYLVHFIATVMTQLVHGAAADVKVYLVHFRATVMTQLVQWTKHSVEADYN